MSVQKCYILIIIHKFRSQNIFKSFHIILIHDLKYNIKVVLKYHQFFNEEITHIQIYLLFISSGIYNG